MNRRTIWTLASVTILLIGGCAQTGPGPPARPCRPAEIPPALAVTKDSALQNIPDRKHHASAPTAGWCGETALQEALLFCGAYFPQKTINRAGEPEHPDLYAHDIPVAVKGLGAGFQWAEHCSDLPKFLDWVRARIKAGLPVFAGVKINPTQHPEWGLDHFVLVVGFDEKSLTFNTTWGRRITRTVEQLASTKAKGYAFANAFGSYYAMALTGPAKREKGEVPVRLFVTKETDKTMDVIVRCGPLQPGADYVVAKSPAFNKPAPPFAAFKAPAAIYAFRETIPKTTSTIYRCRQKSR